ncbi:MAG: hypothetical protein WBV25_12905, partial [Methylocella sp.]
VQGLAVPPGKNPIKPFHGFDLPSALRERTSPSWGAFMNVPERAVHSALWKHFLNQFTALISRQGHKI